MAGTATPKSSTPDRTANVEAAAEHDYWFRAEVQKALTEADDPQVEWVPHEEVERDWAAQRAHLVKSRTARS